MRHTRGGWPRRGTCAGRLDEAPAPAVAAAPAAPPAAPAAAAPPVAVLSRSPLWPPPLPAPLPPPAVRPPRPPLPPPGRAKGAACGPPPPGPRVMPTLAATNATSQPSQPRGRALTGRVAPCAHSGRGRALSRASCRGDERLSLHHMFHNINAMCLQYVTPTGSGLKGLGRMPCRASLAACWAGGGRAHRCCAASPGALR